MTNFFKRCIFLFSLALLVLGFSFFTPPLMAEEVISVRFELNGGEGEIFTIDQIVGSPYVLPETSPKKADYVFEGWSKEINGNVITGFDQVTNNTTILYARWNALTFSSSFINEEGGYYILNGFNTDYENKTKIEIPANYDNQKNGLAPVKKISNNAFEGLTNIEKIDFSTALNLNEIGEYAFKGCDNSGTITLPSYLNNLGQGAFEDCININRVIIQSSLSIPNLAFNGCTSIKRIDFGDSINEIGEKAFCNNINLEKVVLPSGVNIIKKSAFEGCSKLLTVNLNNLKNIENDVFKACNALNRIDIKNEGLLNLIKDTSSGIDYCTAFLGTYPIVVEKSLYDRYTSDASYGNYKNRLTYEIVLEYELNGGEGPFKPEEYTKLYKNYFGVLPNLTKEGYTFKGFSKTNNGEIIKPNDICDVEKVYAIFEINSYMISFITNDGTDIENLTLNYQEDITLPENPTKQDRTFGGWYLDENYSEKFELKKMPSKDLTLYAKWLMSQPTVSISADKLTAIFGEEVKVTVTYVYDIEAEITYEWYRVIDGVDYKLNNSTNELTLFNIKDSGEYYCKVIAKSGTDVGEAKSEIIKITIARQNEAGWVLPVLILIAGVIVAVVIIAYAVGKPRKHKSKE